MSYEVRYFGPHREPARQLESWEELCRMKVGVLWLLCGCGEQHRVMLVGSPERLLISPASGAPDREDDVIQALPDPHPEMAGRTWNVTRLSVELGNVYVVIGESRTQASETQRNKAKENA